MYNFVFSGDENYLKYTALCITSIVKNTDITKTFAWQDNTTNTQESSTKNTKIENLDATIKFIFHIFSDAISQEMLHKLQALESELNQYFLEKCQEHKILERNYCVDIKTYIMTDDIFHGQAKWRGNYLAYYRLKTSFLLDIECEKLLYLDGDTLVNCDIRELFEYDTKNVTCAVVANNYPVNYALDARFGNNKYHFFPSQFYFNSGVMLINYPKWKQDNIEQKALKFLQRYLPKAPDQDALNAVIEDVCPLPFKWNVMVHSQFLSEDSCAYNCKYKDEDIAFNNPHTRCDYLEGLKNPKIIHYAKKPWNSKGLIITHDNKIVYYPYFSLWWDMAQNVPIFSKELLAIQESKPYKEALKKEEKMIQMLREKSFTFYWFSIKGYLKPLSRKIEAPFKKIRNYFRSQKVRNISK